MGTLGQKLDYLTDTKSILKQKINNLGGSLTDESTFRSYGDYLDELYDEMPKVTGEGTEITLTPTRKGRMQLDLKGNTSQASYTGKNLYNATMEATTTRGITRSADRQRIYINGTVETAGNQDFPLSDIDFPAGTYTLSYEIESGTITGTNGLNLYIYSNPNYGRSPVGRINPDTNKDSVSVTLTDSAKIYIHMYGQTVDVSYTNVVIKYQITNGSNADYNFEQYVGGVPSPNPDYPQDIHVVTGNNTIEVQGKNLCKIERGTGTPPKVSHGVSYSYTNNNIISAIGTSDGAGGGESYLLEGTFKAGTYTISGLPNKEVGTDDRGTIYIWYNTIPNTSLTNADQTITGNYSKKTFTITEDAKIGIRIISQGNNADKTYNQEYNIQLEQGSTATDYVPYVEPQNYPINLGNIELCKIGDYQDYLYKENGNWYKYETIKKIILNGTEKWDIANNVFYCFSYDDYAISNNIPFCNRYKGVINKYGTAQVTTNNTIAFNRSISASRVFIRDERYTEVSDLKNELSNNNAIVYYVGISSASTQITDETLISQLDAIENAMSTIDATTTTQTNSDLPFIINASALKPFTTETLLTSLTDDE